MPSRSVHVQRANARPRRVSAASRCITRTPHHGYVQSYPRHRVWLEAFYMDANEVTNREYRKFVDAGGYTQQKYWSLDGWQFLQKDKLTVPGFWTDTQFSQPEQPVVGVSWYEADAYCRWAGKQLPSEAQWEKVARGTDGRQYPWGNAPVDGKRANYCDTQCENPYQERARPPSQRRRLPVCRAGGGP